MTNPRDAKTAPEPPDWEGFGRALMEEWQTHCDIDAGTKFDLAIKFGILTEIPGGFDPDKHVDAYSVYTERGDPWYQMNASHADTPARAGMLRLALDVAMAELSPQQPGDSRAVPDWFVACAAVQCDLDDMDGKIAECLKSALKDAEAAALQPGEAGAEPVASRVYVGGEASVAVCSFCDISGCHHIRATNTTPPAAPTDNTALPTEAGAEDWDSPEELPVEWEPTEAGAEPVAWMMKAEGLATRFTTYKQLAELESKGGWAIIPVYYTPPAAPTDNTALVEAAKGLLKNYHSGKDIYGWIDAIGDALSSPAPQAVTVEEAARVLLADEHAQVLADAAHRSGVAQTHVRSTLRSVIALAGERG